MIVHSKKLFFTPAVELTTRLSFSFEQIKITKHSINFRKNKLKKTLQYIYLLDNIRDIRDWHFCFEY